MQKLKEKWVDPFLHSLNVVKAILSQHLIDKNPMEINGETHLSLANKHDRQHVFAFLQKHISNDWKHVEFLSKVFLREKKINWITSKLDKQF